MVRCIEGAVQLEGTRTQIVAEFIAIISGMYMFIEAEEGDELARSVIAEAARIAFEEIDEQVKRRTEES